MSIRPITIDRRQRSADMQGTRVEYSGGELPSAGSYWRDGRDGDWYAITPNGLYAGLAAHDVVEHSDGTITVAPSLLVRGVHVEDKVADGVATRILGPVEWHGYLERGEWRAC